MFVISLRGITLCCGDVYVKICQYAWTSQYESKDMKKTNEDIMHLSARYGSASFLEVQDNQPIYRGLTSVLCMESVCSFNTSHFRRKMKLANPSSFMLTIPVLTTCVLNTA